MFTQLIIEAIAWMGSWRKSQVMEFSRTNGKKVVWLGMKFNSARLIQHSGYDCWVQWWYQNYPSDTGIRYWECGRVRRRRGRNCELGMPSAPHHACWDGQWSTIWGQGFCDYPWLPPKGKQRSLSTAPLLGAVHISHHHYNFPQKW